MVGIGFPAPVRGRCREVAETLLAFGKLLLGPVLFGDVPVHGHPAAAGQRRRREGDGSAARQIPGTAYRVIEPRDAVHHFRGRVDLAVRHDACAPQVGKQFVNMAARHGKLRRKAIQLGIEIIADDQPPVRVEHGEAVCHVLDGALEQYVLGAKQLLALALLRDIAVDTQKPRRAFRVAGAGKGGSDMPDRAVGRDDPERGVEPRFGGDGLARPGDGGGGIVWMQGVFPGLEWRNCRRRCPEIHRCRQAPGRR